MVDKLHPRTGLVSADIKLMIMSTRHNLTYTSGSRPNYVVSVVKFTLVKDHLRINRLKRSFLHCFDKNLASYFVLINTITLSSCLIFAALMKL